MVFQIFILRAPIQDFLKVAAGTISVIVGLAFFMEGLFLGIMPLGERCGLHLLGRAGLRALAGFSVVVGLTAHFVVGEKLPQPDEIFLGLVFSLIGLFLFGLGMDCGLGSLGRQSGASLPRAFESTERPDKAVLYTGLDESLVLRTVRSDGGVGEYLVVDSPTGPEFILFNRERYDADQKSYLLVPKDEAIAGANRVWGYLLVLLFVFIMGLGAILAEPSLNALGVTLEELTTGTYRRFFLVTNVGIGVGIGILACASVFPIIACSPPDYTCGPGAERPLNRGCMKHEMPGGFQNKLHSGFPALTLGGCRT